MKVGAEFIKTNCREMWKSIDEVFKTLYETNFVMRFGHTMMHPQKTLITTGCNLISIKQQI